MKHCYGCGKALEGKQRRWCSETCKKRVQRHPDQHPVPAKPLPPEIADAIAEVDATGQVPSVEQAASGTQREALVALRQRLAWQIDTCDDPRAVATLSNRFMDNLDRIAALDAEGAQAGGFLDELTRRRAERAKARGADTVVSGEA